MDRQRTADARRGRRDLVAVARDSPADAEELTMRRDRERQLWRAVDARPEKLRLVVVLAAIEGHDARGVCARGHVGSRGQVAAAPGAPEAGGGAGMAQERDELSAIDDALRQALAVAPSPEFLPRVRVRVRRPRRRTWTRVLPAAAVVLLALAASLWLRTRAARVVPLAAVASPAPVTIETARPPVAPAPTRVIAARPVRVAREPRVAPVLVPRGEELKIARYVASVRRRPFADDALPDTNPRAPLAEPAAIAVRPIAARPMFLEEGSFR